MGNPVYHLKRSEVAPTDYFVCPYVDLNMFGYVYLKLMNKFCLQEHLVFLVVKIEPFCS